jgi:putative SOS response-associated peptidase YedK
MCGRFTQTISLEALIQQFNVEEPIPLFKANYNIAPTQKIVAVRRKAESEKRECVFLRWGLIPVWAKEAKFGNQCINAKCETVAEKPAYRSAFKKRRCLIVANGFYEWQRLGDRKQPMWIGRRDKKPFAFAGLWEWWQPPAGDSETPAAPIESCTIITTEPNELMSDIHNRMPVILPPSSYDEWLAPTAQTEPLKALLRSCPSEDLFAYPVSPMVNSPKINAPELLEPIVV